MTSATRPDASDTTRPAVRGPLLSGLAVGAYAGAVYLFFLAVVGYSIGFFGDFGVPKTIDSGSRSSVPVAVVVDVLLLNLFAAQHTVMARPWFKRMWTRVVPAAAERSTFVLAANLVLTLLFWQWRPVGATVWHVEGRAAVPFRVAYAAGWVLVFGSTFLISHPDLFGLRQAWLRMRRAPYTPPPFTERGLYRHIRHPLMAGFLVVFFAAPVMTAGHALFALASAGYIVVGIAFEERDLVKGLGRTYASYRARVPALIPIPRRLRK